MIRRITWSCELFPIAMSEWREVFEALVCPGEGGFVYVPPSWPGSWRQAGWWDGERLGWWDGERLGWWDGERLGWWDGEGLLGRDRLAGWLVGEAGRWDEEAGRCDAETGWWDELYLVGERPNFGHPILYLSF